MNKIIDIENEGMESLLGQVVTLMCAKQTDATAEQGSSQAEIERLNDAVNFCAGYINGHRCESGNTEQPEETRAWIFSVIDAHIREQLK